MDRTRKLIACVSASVLLLGPGAAQGGAPGAHPLDQNKEVVEDDPAVKEAAQTIRELLRGKESKDALSLDDIIQQVHVQREIAQRALRLLNYQGKISKIGSDTKDDPYRYYDRHTIEG